MEGFVAAVEVELMEVESEGAIGVAAKEAEKVSYSVPVI